MEKTAKALGLLAVVSKEREEILALLECARSIGLTLFKQKFCSKISQKAPLLQVVAPCTHTAFFELLISFVERRIDEVIVVCCSK